jgi:DNA-directed RNA polymerase subunit N (RpoN/RPB10)
MVYIRCLKCGKRFWAKYSKFVYCYDCYKGLDTSYSQPKKTQPEPSKPFQIEDLSKGGDKNGTM